MDTRNNPLTLIPLLALWSATACGSEPSPPPAPPAQGEAPAEPPTPVAEAPKPAAAPEEPNPCDKPQAVELELPAGQIVTSPWGLEFTYAIGGDRVAKGPPTYIFLLRHGQRRWETRRSASDWTQRKTWRGFCWRGLGRPERRAARVKLQVQPVCDAQGKLVEMGGCGDALAD
ncbi:MAG: hypothetical protein OEZ06_20085 [Myxococcales bacterium]|nr:hypothetical protein [Myxococcales bacterium]